MSIRSLFAFTCHACQCKCKPFHIVIVVSTPTLNLRKHFCGPVCLRGWLGPG